MRIFNHQHGQVVFWVLLAMSLVSCGSSPTSVLEKYVREELKVADEDKFKFVSFKKLNGQKADFMGIETHVIEYEVFYENKITLLYELSSTTHEEAVKERPQFSGSYLPSEIKITAGRKDGIVLGHEIFRYSHSGMYKWVKKGTLYSFKGKETLRKSDNGWIVD